MKTPKLDQRIECERGATYASEQFAVYQYGTYPRHSVLSGQTSRRYVGGPYKTVAEAMAEFPQATESGCGYTPPCLSHLPEADGPDPFGDNEEAYRDN